MKRMMEKEVSDDDEFKQLSREVIDLLQKRGEGKVDKQKKREQKAEMKASQRVAATCDVEKPTDAKQLTDKQGNTYLELTGTRRITLSKFRGKARVDIREFYQ